jgi:Fe-S-cluster containining protein
MQPYPLGWRAKLRTPDILPQYPMVLPNGDAPRRISGRQLMGDEHEGGDGPLAAGDFASWVGEMQGAIGGEHESRVPCAGCTACCTSSQFVHIEPDETDTLAHIPAELLFPAPHRPRGHVLLGYDERGHCPMLVDNACSIYERRPRTCRVYDCRIFPAAGVELEPDGDQALIAQRARRWVFGFPTPDDHIRSEAVRAAATFLRDNPELFADAVGAPNATARAVLAAELHHLFLRSDEATGAMTIGAPSPDAVRVELARRRGRR